MVFFSSHNFTRHSVMSDLTSMMKSQESKTRPLKQGEQVIRNSDNKLKGKKEFAKRKWELIKYKVKKSKKFNGIIYSFLINLINNCTGFIY